MHVRDDIGAEDYLREVDDLLLSLSWRRRRAALDELALALRVQGEPPISCPAAYAEAVLSAESTVPGVRLSRRGLVRWDWPTPLEWFAAGLRGLALLTGLLFAYGFLHDLTHQLMWNGTGLSDVVHAVQFPFDSSVTQWMLSPTRLAGLTVVLGWLLGQYLNGRRLESDARARRSQLPANTAAIAWLVLCVMWTLPGVGGYVTALSGLVG